MKPLFFLIACLAFVSCSNDPAEKKSANADTSSRQLNSMTGPDSDPWNFNKYLNDPATPKAAKDIFRKKWKYRDDEPLEYIAMLHGSNVDARPFYFKVVTNLYHYADGAISEGLGHGGYEYVRQHPAEFAGYFAGKNAFPEKDLKTWAEIVLLEFQLVTDVEFEKPRFQQYLAQVRKNCTGCTKEQLDVLARLEKYMKEGWAEFLSTT